MQGVVLYGGLKMDGVLQGRMFKEWEAYRDPVVSEFPDKFKNYRPAWPDFDDHITVDVSHHVDNVEGLLLIIYYPPEVTKQEYWGLGIFL